MLAVVQKFANVPGMNLEDHPGDIIHKAREMANVSAAAAAAAAGLTEAQLSELEALGKSSKPIIFTALGKLLDLDPQKLIGIAGGWRPAPVDLSLWRELRVITTKTEQFSVNCFLVWDEVTREAALFDSGLDAQPVFDFVASEQLSLRHIFITHS